ncbi:Neural-cadherin-like 24, partial [Homarus americanus]
SPLEFRITAGNEAGLFSLVPASGRLHLLRPLDYEKQQRVSWSLLMWYKHRHRCRIGTARVGGRGEVWEEESGQGRCGGSENDHLPTFPTSLHETQITEDDDRHLPKVLLTDCKTLQLSLKQVSLGRPSRAAKQGPPHGRARWRLVVTATDGDHEASTTVHVNLKDVNDNAPYFPQATVNATIPEDTPLGNAEDNDDPLEGHNAQLLYSLEKNAIDESTGSPIFAVDSQRGVITTAVCCLDREKTQHYAIQVVATDGGGLKGTGTILVDVADVNDVAPRFTRPEWVLDVSESLAPDHVLATLTVIDPDVDNLHLQGGRGWERFQLEGRQEGGGPGGDLRALTALDYENPEHRRGFSFRVQVSDVTGNSWQDRHHVDSAWVNLTLVDANDNPPTLAAHHVYPASDPGGKFRVDETGTVWLVGGLDRETNAAHTVLMWAVDDGVPPRTATATLSVKVTDVVTPVLGRASKGREENTGPRVVAKVKLGDPDDWKSGHGPPFTIMTLEHHLTSLQLSPSATTIVSGGDDGRGVGVVRTRAALNRKERRALLVPLVVSDAGALSASLTLTLHVADLNDNPMTSGAKTVTVRHLQPRSSLPPPTATGFISPPPTATDSSLPPPTATGFISPPLPSYLSLPATDSSLPPPQPQVHLSLLPTARLHLSLLPTATGSSHSSYSHRPHLSLLPTATGFISPLLQPQDSSHSSYSRFISPSSYSHRLHLSPPPTATGFISPPPTAQDSSLPPPTAQLSPPSSSTVHLSSSLQHKFISPPPRHRIHLSSSYSHRFISPSSCSHGFISHPPTATGFISPSPTATGSLPPPQPQASSLTPPTATGFISPPPTATGFISPPTATGFISPPTATGFISPPPTATGFISHSSYSHRIHLLLLLQPQVHLSSSLQPSSSLLLPTATGFISPLLQPQASSLLLLQPQFISSSYSHRFISPSSQPQDSSLTPPYSHRIHLSLLLQPQASLPSSYSHNSSHSSYSHRIHLSLPHSHKFISPPPTATDFISSLLQPQDSSLTPPTATGFISPPPTATGFISPPPLNPFLSSSYRIHLSLLLQPQASSLPPPTATGFIFPPPTATDSSLLLLQPQDSSLLLLQPQASSVPLLQPQVHLSSSYSHRIHLSLLLQPQDSSLHSSYIQASVSLLHTGSSHSSYSHRIHLPPPTATGFISHSSCSHRLHLSSSYSQASSLLLLQPQDSSLLLLQPQDSSLLLLQPQASSLPPPTATGFISPSSYSHRIHLSSSYSHRIHLSLLLQPQIHLSSSLQPQDSSLLLLQPQFISPSSLQPQASSLTLLHHRIHLSLLLQPQDSLSSSYSHRLHLSLLLQPQVHLSLLLQPQVHLSLLLQPQDSSLLLLQPQASSLPPPTATGFISPSSYSHKFISPSSLQPQASSLPPPPTATVHLSSSYSHRFISPPPYSHRIHSLPPPYSHRIHLPPPTAGFISLPYHRLHLSSSYSHRIHLSLPTATGFISPSSYSHRLHLSPLLPTATGFISPSSLQPQAHLSLLLQPRFISPPPTATGFISPSPSSHAPPPTATGFISPSSYTGSSLLLLQPRFISPPPTAQDSSLLLYNIHLSLLLHHKFISPPPTATGFISSSYSHRIHLSLLLQPQDSSLPLLPTATGSSLSSFLFISLLLQPQDSSLPLLQPQDSSPHSYSHRFISPPPTATGRCSAAGESM